MSNVPPIELLEETHDFPCDYVFKVIGHAAGGFEARVVAAVRDELGLVRDPPYTTRETTSGKHVAVTLTPTVETARQVLMVYSRLQTLAGVVVVL